MDFGGFSYTQMSQMQANLAKRERSQDEHMRDVDNSVSVQEIGSVSRVVLAVCVDGVCVGERVPCAVTGPPNFPGTQAYRDEHRRCRIANLSNSNI